ncbi:MAG: flavodoxin family protein [Thalassovita sp.]
MGNVAITYFSGRGHTRKLADKIAVALGQEGCAARLIDVTDLSQTDWQAMEAADAILLGAPTYMGSIAAEYKSFMDATSDIWSEQLWADKLAAGFTVATFPGGDKLSSLMQLNIFAMQHGMIWVGQDQIGAPVNTDAEGLECQRHMVGAGGHHGAGQNADGVAGRFGNGASVRAADCAGGTTLVYLDGV